jgi:hypothetical protein
MSSAAFFVPPPRQQENSQVFSLRSLLLSLPFYVQLAVLIAALGAFYLWLIPPEVGETEPAVGAAIYVDTSASMSVLAAPGTAESRLDQALARVEYITTHLRMQPDEITVCVRLSRFDSVIASLGTAPDRLSFDAINASALALTSIFEYRILETNLGALQREIRSVLDPGDLAESTDCAITHVVVITDAPAPDWLAEFEDSERIIWLNVGAPIDNAGIVNLTSDQAACPLVSGGAATTVRVEFANYGANAPQTVTVSGSNGFSAVRPLDFVRQLIYPFTLTDSSTYTFTLTDGGGYAYDDTAVIDVRAGDSLRVDWQMTDPTWAQRFGWTMDTISPDVRVQPYNAVPVGDSVPTLYVGDGYHQPTAAAIAYFQETNPLLAGLDLDVAETLGIRGVDLTIDTRLQPALIDVDGRTWFALSPTADGARAAYIPGLPVDTDMNAFRFSSTAFINALCWLLNARTDVRSFTLTDDLHPLPGGTRLTLFPEEGNTLVVGTSSDSTVQLQPLESNVQFPIWLIAAAVAALIFVVERVFSAFLEDRWN